MKLRVIEVTGIGTVLVDKWKKSSTDLTWRISHFGLAVSKSQLVPDFFHVWILPRLCALGNKYGNLHCCIPPTLQAKVHIWMVIAMIYDLTIMKSDFSIG